VKYLLVFSSLIISAFSLFGQEYSFDTYSTNEGLSQSQVYDLHQDELGYLWIATEGGLNRFDGKSFKVFSSEDGLLKDAIRCIYYSDKGKKKYYGSVGGISVFENKEFKTHKFRDNSDIRVSCIQEYQDTVFAGTNGFGLFYLKGDTLVQYPFLNSENLKIRSLFVNGSSLMIGTHKGLRIKFKNQGYKVYDKSLSIGRIKTNGSEIIVGTFNNGLFRFRDKRLKKLDVKNGKEVIRNFEFTHDGIFYITRSSLVKFNLSTNQLEYKLTKENGLPNADLFTTFIDRENNLWIGTEGKGITRFVGETFVSYTTKEKLSSNQIMYINKIDSTFYFGSYNNGVTIWDENGDSRIINKSNGLPHNTVWTMWVEGKNNVLIGTQKGLVHYYNGQIKNLTETFGEDPFKVTAICKVAEDEYIIGGKLGVIYLNHGEIEEGFFGQKLNTYIRDIKKGTNNSIWFATMSGLYVYQNSNLKRIRNNGMFNEVNCIDFINENTAILGTDNGVYFSTKDKIFESNLDLSHSSREINMIKHFDNRICFGTNSGLFIVDFNEGDMSLNNLKRFSSKDGLPGSEINLNSVFVENNDLWFGTEEALVKFNLDRTFDLEDFVEPKVVISNLEIFMEGKSLSDFSSGIDEKGLPINLELPYRFNYFSLEFNGLSFKNNKEILYQYKLEGLNDNWTPLLENNFATFTSLAPGEYVFKVRAINKSGLISEEAEFSFVVLPPIWLTWWFITLSLVVIIGIVVFIVNYRTKTIKQKKDNENLMYKSKLLLLEQQSLNASMNRHFIFNSLNSIQYFINVSDKISANKYLTNFAKLIRKNLDSTTNENNMVVLSDEINRLELYLSLESMRFSDKFNYEILIEPEVDVEMVQVPSMMLQPFVENSIIHGILPKKEGGTIKIHVFIKQGFTVFEIVDNGIGIKKSRELKKNYDSEHDSKGMEITANRVDILKRILRTDLKIVGPNETYNKEGGITGTKVEIFLKSH
jgi:ligand-binding sensor domain-containing protein